MFQENSLLDVGIKISSIYGDQFGVRREELRKIGKKSEEAVSGLDVGKYL